MRFIKNFYRYRYFLILLIKKEFMIKYKSSFLGVIWSLLNPLFISLVMYFVFGTMFGRGSEFLIYLTCGRVFFTFMQVGTTSAMTAVLSSKGLTSKVYVPKYYFPLARVIVNSIESLLAVLVIFLLLPIAKVPYSVNNLYVFIPLLILVIFSYGLGLIVATINVFFRDVQHLYTVFLVAWMYFTPIFYPQELIVDRVDFVGKLSLFNPMYYFVTMARDAMLNGSALQVSHVVITTLLSLTMLIVGNVVFLKNQDKFILYL